MWPASACIQVNGLADVLGTKSIRKTPLDGDDDADVDDDDDDGVSSANLRSSSWQHFDLRN